MINEDKRLKTKEQLRDWLGEETARYPNYGRYRIYNFLLLSENAILRRHQILLRKTEYFVNIGKSIRAKLNKMRLDLLQIK